MDFNMCQYTNICWRYFYTKYFQQNPESKNNPPTRKFLVLTGNAPIDIFPNGGISAKTLENCPFLENRDIANCIEKKTKDRQVRHTADFLVFRPAIAKAVRYEIARKAKYTCAYCGRNTNMIDEETGQRIGGVIDHYIPLALGGKHEESNFIYACRQCNSEKSAQLWEIGCKRK